MDVISGSVHTAYQMTYKKVSFLPTVSIGLDYIIQQSGKTFAENEYIIDLSNSQRYVDQLSMHAGIGIQAMYALSDRLSVHFILDQKYTLNNIASMGLSARTARTNANIGIGYQF